MTVEEAKAAVLGKRVNVTGAINNIWCPRPAYPDVHELWPSSWPREQSGMLQHLWHLQAPQASFGFPGKCSQKNVSLPDLILGSIGFSAMPKEKKKTHAAPPTFRCQAVAASHNFWGPRRNHECASANMLDKKHTASASCRP